MRLESGEDFHRHEDKGSRQGPLQYVPRGVAMIVRVQRALSITSLTGAPGFRGDRSLTFAARFDLLGFAEPRT